MSQVYISRKTFGFFFANLLNPFAFNRSLRILTISVNPDYFDSDFGQISVLARDVDSQSTPGDTFNLSITSVNDYVVFTEVNGLQPPGSGDSYSEEINAENPSNLTVVIEANDEIDDQWGDSQTIIYTLENLI